MNDVPAARQSRDDRAGVEPARIDSPRVHQKGKPPKRRLFFAIIKGESKGAGVNDVPVARQSRDDRAGVEPARIDSPRVHQKGKHPRACKISGKIIITE